MSDLKITGVIVGDLANGQPKAIELTALADIENLNLYAIGSAEDGGPSAPEALLEGSVKAGEKIYAAADTDAFTTFFGFEPNQGAANALDTIDGDDAIALFKDDDGFLMGDPAFTTIDVFGEVGTDGRGEAWEYTNGWAYRKPDTGPDGDTFNLDNWILSGPNALDNETSNVTAAQAVPIPTVYLVESDNSTNISESGITDTYEVVLNTQPTDTVIVTVTPDAQTSLNDSGAGNPILLTFTPETYNQAQTVSVSAIADSGSTDARTITHTVTSNDANYDSSLNTAVVVNTNSNSINNENEVVPTTLSDPGVTIIESDGATIISEGSITDTYEIVLNTAPTSDVTITIDPDDQAKVNQKEVGEAVELTFTPENFAEPQTVTVMAVNDGTFEGEHSSLIQHSADSLDSDYNSANDLTIPDVTATILNPGITITGLTTDPNLEGEKTEYNVVLNTIPLQSVTVTVTAQPDAQIDLGEGPGMSIDLIFDPNDGSFSQSQTVEATLVDSDDSGEGRHSGTIRHTSTSLDPSYVIGNNAAIEITLDITEPGISIIQTDGSTTVSEGGIEDQYQIVLNSVPEDTVTVTITPDAQTNVGAGLGEPFQVEFDPTADGFSQTQTITVSTEDDGIPGTRQGSISHTSSSDDPNYASDALPSINTTVIDCFLTGTRILTEVGEKLVEELKIGDRLQTLDGSLEPIKWIGIQTCYTNSHHHPLRTYPIRVKAGALGQNCPIRDLYVSPDHALLVAGVLVNAGALENGDSIVQIQPTADKFVYYHIELDRHNIVIADGAPAESYLPQKQDRNTFDNGADYATLYPHSNIQALVPMRYPRVSSKRQLPRFITKYIQQVQKNRSDAGVTQLGSISIFDT